MEKEKNLLYWELQRRKAAERQKITEKLEEKEVENFLNEYQQVVNEYNLGFQRKEGKTLSEEGKPEWFEEREKEIEEKVANLSKELGATPEEIKVIKTESFKRLSDFMRKKKWLEKILEKSNLSFDLFRKFISSKAISEISGNIFGKAKEQYNFNRKVRKEIEENLLLESPEAFMASALLKIREYKKQLPSGIIETNYPFTQKEVVKNALLKNRLAALVGETGTGKTKIAVKIAQELNRGYEFVPGHKFMTSTDLFSYLGLDVEKIKAEDVPSQIKKALEKFYEKNPNLSKKEKEEGARDIKAVIRGQAENPELKSKIFYAGVLKAAREGKIVIIDEFNYIPPGLLASCNALIEAKPGEKISIADQEVEVKAGFGVILTGNITKQEFEGRYHQREKIDPALLNRLNSGLIEYLSLPQDVEISFASSIVSPDELKEGREIPKRELFQIALTILTDKKANLSGSKNLLRNIWNLSRDFSLFQKIYGGEVIPSKVRLPNDQPVILRNYPISNRTFLSIIEGFKKDGFNYDLEWYIYDNLLRPASVASSAEAGQMLSILKQRGFFSSEIWDVLKVDPSTYKLLGIENIEREKMAFKEKTKISEKKHLFSPKEIAEAFYGRFTPEIQTIVTIEKEKTKEMFEKSRNLETAYENIKKFISSFEENIVSFCELERNFQKK